VRQHLGALRECIIARYGVPKVVITDDGVQLASRIFKSFLAEMGIRQQFTAPYTPKENPSEREKRTVKTMIAKFAGQNQRNWDGKWLEIMLAVNTSTSESTDHDVRWPLPGCRFHLSSDLQNTPHTFKERTDRSR